MKNATTTMNDSHLSFYGSLQLSPEKKTTSFYQLRIQFIHFKKVLYNGRCYSSFKKKNAMPLWSYCAYMTYG